MQLLCWTEGHAEHLQNGIEHQKTNANEQYHPENPEQPESSPIGNGFFVYMDFPFERRSLLPQALWQAWKSGTAAAPKVSGDPEVFVFILHSLSFWTAV